MPTPLATDGSGSTAIPLNDCFGYKTETAGTAIRRAIRSRLGARARISSWAVTPGVTAHEMVIMVSQARGTTTSEAAAAQGAVPLNDIPTDFAGALTVATDLFILTHEDGSQGIYEVSSLSGLTVTFTPVLTKKVLSGAKWWFMGVAGDHTDRRFRCAASTFREFKGTDSRLVAGVSGGNDEPLIVSVDNITNAGYLEHVAFTYESGTST